MRWLISEYQEPQVDWRKVEVDTPILVSSDGEHWLNRYFARYENELVFVWKNGATSWSDGNSNLYNAWAYAKLAEEGDTDA